MYLPVAAAAFLVALVLGPVVRAAGEPVIVGILPFWSQETAELDFSPYTHVNLAYAVPFANGSLSINSDFDLMETVSRIHESDAKALVSVGGWSGSQHFSTIMQDETAYQSLISGIMDCIVTAGLDGIDIEWKYPGTKSGECTAYDEAADTPNFLVFLKALRKTLDTEFGQGEKQITLGLYTGPFKVDGKASTNVTEFAQQVNYAHLQAYDKTGTWQNKTAPNAPITSLAGAIESWTGAGWPAEQLTAGLAFYGISTTALADMTQDATNQKQPQSAVIPQGDPEDALSTDECDGNGTYSGWWQYKYLRSEGVLGNATEAVSPWVRQWDDKSQTPWLFNPETKAFISYDDPESIKTKVDCAVTYGLAGVSVFAAGYDYENELMDSVLTWNSASPNDTVPDEGKQDENTKDEEGQEEESQEEEGQDEGGPKDNDEKVTLDDDGDDTSQEEEVGLKEEKEDPRFRQFGGGGGSEEGEGGEHKGEALGKTSKPVQESSSQGGSVTDEEGPETKIGNTKNVVDPRKDTDSTQKSPSDEEEDPSGQCLDQDEGTLSCVDENNSPEYHICVANNLILLTCDSRTVCKADNASIICAWPE